MLGKCMATESPVTWGKGCVGGAAPRHSRASAWFVTPSGSRAFHLCDGCREGGRKRHSNFGGLTPFLYPTLVLLFPIRWASTTGLQVRWRLTFPRRKTRKLLTTIVYLASHRWVPKQTSVKYSIVKKC